MKLSTKSRYGVRALLEIAMYYEKGSVKRKMISENQEIPDSYLENILIILKKSGFIQTKRGVGGGYELCRKPSEITVLDLIKALEGTFYTVHCIDSPEKCTRSKFCATRPVWQKLNEIQEKKNIKTLIMAIEG